MLKHIKATDFKKILKTKKREIVYTRHSFHQAKKRHFKYSLEKFRINIFEEDIRIMPAYVFEEHSEFQDERKFRLYYEIRKGIYRTYVVCINSQIRLITLLRVKKDLQKKLCEHMKKR